MIVILIDLGSIILFYLEELFGVRSTTKQINKAK